MFSQNIHNVKKLNVEIKYYPAATNTSGAKTFWSVNFNAVNEDGTTFSTSYFTNTKPVELISNFGLSQGVALFDESTEKNVIDIDPTTAINN